MSKPLPSKIIFQWHLTDKCNFRCAHCYQESYQDNGLSFDRLLSILDQLSAFVSACKLEHKNVKAHINFTGGEPFLKTDFLDLLQETVSREMFTFGILSNGFLLPEHQLIELKALKPEFVQISLEGNEEMNNQIRGKGTYQQIIQSIKTYSKLGIRVLLSFTANAQNYTHFAEVVKVAKKYNAYKVWTDRYIPSQPNDPLALGSLQTKDFFQTIHKEQNKFQLFNKTKVSSGRALQFLVAGGRPYTCSAGDTLLAILPNGDLLPCRRLPIKIGNVFQRNLLDLYLENKILQELRNPDRMDERCLSCHYKTSCKGGLRCLSYAQYGDPFKKDPGCWI